VVTAASGGGGRSPLAPALRLALGRRPVVAVAISDPEI
jgi:hypothetical protein